MNGPLADQLIYFLCAFPCHTVFERSQLTGLEAVVHDLFITLEAGQLRAPLATVFSHQHGQFSTKIEFAGVCLVNSLYFMRNKHLTSCSYIYQGSFTYSI